MSRKPRGPAPRFAPPPSGRKRERRKGLSGQSRKPGDGSFRLPPLPFFAFSPFRPFATKKWVLTPAALRPLSLRLAVPPLVCDLRLLAHSQEPDPLDVCHEWAEERGLRGPGQLPVPAVRPGLSHSGLEHCCLCLLLGLPTT